MRLRTLPVSLGGVIAGIALAAHAGPVRWDWAAVCILFALLAQIASNFANEYFDFRAGVDRPDRVGPARGVSLGLISPRAMLRATVVTLALACAVGLLTLLRGGWWLLIAGTLIALGALAYSAGPYPLSRHRLGEVAVIVFFGIVPVSLTYYLQTLWLTIPVIIDSVAIGLMGAMVILVNNYRDIKSDSACGKHTLSTLVGPQGSALIYCAMGQFAAVLLCLGGGFTVWGFLPLIPAALGLIGGYILWRGLLPGASVTRLLALTSLALLLVALGALLASLL